MLKVLIYHIYMMLECPFWSLKALGESWTIGIWAHGERLYYTYMYPVIVILNVYLRYISRYVVLLILNVKVYRFNNAVISQIIR